MENVSRNFKYSLRKKKLDSHSGTQIRENSNIETLKHIKIV